jgi:ribosome recycling factor
MNTTRVATTSLNNRTFTNKCVGTQVDYYGAMTPLKSLAGISVPDATMLVVQPFDLTALKSIERAIMESDLEMTPSNDGKVIRLNIPPLTSVRLGFVVSLFHWPRP